MTPAILQALTGREWDAEVRFAAEHVGMGKGLRDRLKAHGLRDWRADFTCQSIMLMVSPLNVIIFRFAGFQFGLSYR